MGKRSQIMPSSSRRVERYTPAWIFEALNVQFDLDPCAPKGRSPSKDWSSEWISLPQDGLSLPWRGLVWLNPPWTRGSKAQWVAKLAAHGNGIALVRGGVDSSWLHDNAPDSLFLFRGRVDYLAPGRSNRRQDGEIGGLEPSMLLAYGKRASGVVWRAAPELRGMFLDVKGVTVLD
jgi:hypothetical protein